MFAINKLYIIKSFHSYSFVILSNNIFNIMLYLYCILIYFRTSSDSSEITIIFPQFFYYSNPSNKNDFRNLYLNIIVNSKIPHTFSNFQDGRTCFPLLIKDPTSFVMYHSYRRLVFRNYHPQMLP